MWLDGEAQRLHLGGEEGENRMICIDKRTKLVLSDQEVSNGNCGVHQGSIVGLLASQQAHTHTHYHTAGMGSDNHLGWRPPWISKELT